MVRWGRGFTTVIDLFLSVSYHRHSFSTLDRGRALHGIVGFGLSIFYFILFFFFFPLFGGSRTVWMVLLFYTDENILGQDLAKLDVASVVLYS